MKKAVVIIPTYNEVENIEKLVPLLFEVFKSIKNWKMEILVVDDTSPDKTYEQVKKLQKKYSQLHLLLNKEKAGLGRAYLRGMAYAFGKLKANVVFEFDADFSHDHEKIPDFLKKIDGGADLVVGSRYIKGGGIPQNWGLHRKVMSVLGNIFIMTVLTNFTIRDWTGGYRALTKKVYDAVHKEMYTDEFTGYTFQMGFLYKTIKKGFTVEEVPFIFKDRTSGVSKLGSEYFKIALMFVIKTKIKEIIRHRFFKFLLVGGLGTLIQLSSLFIFRSILPEFKLLFLTNFLLAAFISIEIAITSNFILNNLWTFADRRLKARQIPLKFLQFNLASGGSILIQLTVATIGEAVFGLIRLFTIPFINLQFDTGILYVMIGILLGLFWNFFAYNRFVWKKK